MLKNRPAANTKYFIIFVLILGYKGNVFMLNFLFLFLFLSFLLEINVLFGGFCWLFVVGCTLSVVGFYSLLNTCDW